MAAADTAAGADTPAGPETTASLLRRAASANALWLDTSGTSMGPSIVAGDRVLVRPAARPRHGEVWAFCAAQSAIVVHRCRGRRGQGWIFEGDAVGRADPPVAESWLIGRVVSIRHDIVERHLGRRDRALGTLVIVVRRARRVTRRIVHTTLRRALERR